MNTLSAKSTGASRDWKRTALISYCCMLLDEFNNIGININTRNEALDAGLDLSLE
jgi:hypothetical protein